MSSYKWRRASTKQSQLQSEIGSRLKADEDDPRLWCEKVAVATENAVSVVSGKKPSHSGKSRNGMNFAHQEVYIDDEEIQKTAQDLLNQWMNDNVQREKELSEFSTEENIDTHLGEGDRNGSYTSFNLKSSFASPSNGESSTSGYWSSAVSAGGSGKQRRSTMASTGVASDVRQSSTWGFLTPSTSSNEGSNRTESSNYSSATDHYSEESELNKKLAELEEKYELMTVDSILDGILNKQFDQNKHVMTNLGFKQNKVQSTTVTKMQVRHQEVLRKREERLKKSEESKKKKQASMETEEAARKMIFDEEKEKIEQKAEEEKRIRMEMEKIRAEIHEQQSLMRDQLKQEAALKEAEREKRKLQEESRIQKEKMDKMKLEKAKEDSRRKIALRMEQVKLREVRYHMKCLQKHFHAWLNFVVDQRLKMGKAVALSEWRMLSRCYNVWKHSAIQSQCKREAEKHEDCLKRSLQLDKMATEFNKKRILKRCFNRWLLFVTLIHDETDLQKEAEARKERLEKFLDAAKSGKLWSEAKDEDQEELEQSGNSGLPCETSERLSESASQRTSNRSNVSSFKSEKVYRMFNGSPAVTSTPRAQSSNGSAVSKGSSNQLFVRSSTRNLSNMQPWQVRRNMVSDLTIEQLEQIGQSTKKAITDSAKQVQEKLTEKQIAQQKQLEHQEKVLKNQQKVIDQLQRQLVSANKSVNAGVPCGTPELTETCGTPTVDGAESLVSMRTPSAVAPEGSSERSEVPSSRVSAISATKKHDPIVSAMEERERIRQEKRAKFEALKRKKEEEKLRLAKIEQEELEKALQEEKRVAAEKKRQEMLQQKEAEKRKAEAQSKLQALTEKAENFNNYRLKKYYGLYVFKKSVEVSKNNEEKAQLHFAKVSCGKCFHAWRADSRSSAELKRQMASELYSYFLIRRHFKSWCRYKEILDILAIKAERHRSRVLKGAFFRLWVEFTDERRTENLMNWEIAEKHNEERLQRTCLNVWKRLPSMERAERERLNRRAELRSLVAQIIPDFKGTAADDVRDDSVVSSSHVFSEEGDPSKRSVPPNESSRLTSFAFRKSEFLD